MATATSPSAIEIAAMAASARCVEIVSGFSAIAASQAPALEIAPIPSGQRHAHHQARSRRRPRRRPARGRWQGSARRP